MNTIKLYDINAYLNEFSATVTECIFENGYYKTVLNKTAFFAEAGGQKADSGYIDDIYVFNVQIENDIIYHYTEEPFKTGKTVNCKINFAERYRKMQIHTGEHIISGVMHNMFGLDNIGFHLGTDETTLDFNAILTREQLNAVEDAANKIIYKNVPVMCYYPDEKDIHGINYRCKKELEGAIRIVEIKGYDICACCAPHVANTGEVGIIKLTHFEKCKGGTRITMLCAMDALLDYREKSRNTAAISAMLCSKQNETATAVENLIGEKNNLNAIVTDLKHNLISLKADAAEKSDKLFLTFENSLSIPDMRNFANKVAEKRPTVCVFSRSVKSGFDFVCAGNNMKQLLERFKLQFSVSGGGSDKMIQGNILATENEIKDFLYSNIDK